MPNTTGSINLIEFHNQCHGSSDGKFCETPGPGASGGDWPKQEGREVTESKPNENGYIDDVPCLKAYSVKASDGAEIKAYLVDGVDNKSAIQKTLNSIAQQHEMYPSSPPRRAIIVEDNFARAIFGFNGTRTAAWVYSGEGYSKNMFVNSSNLYTNRFSDLVSNPKHKNWFMPSAQEVDPVHYLVSHESGHQYDFIAGRNAAKPLYKNKAIRKQLSKYGQKPAIEAYAEAFAEWHTTKGKTSNPAARAYAQHEGWYGTDGYKKPSLKASGGPVEFQNEPAVDKLKDLYPKNGPVVGDTFDADKGPIVVGDFPDEAVSEKEQADADKMVEEVYRAMGFDANGDKLQYKNPRKKEESSVTGAITLHLIGQHDQSSHGGGGGGGHSRASHGALVDKPLNQVIQKAPPGSLQPYTVKYKELKTANLSKFSDSGLKQLNRQMTNDKIASDSFKSVGTVIGALGVAYSGIAKKTDKDAIPGVIVGATAAILVGLGTLRSRQVSKQQKRVRDELSNRGLNTKVDGLSLVAPLEFNLEEEIKSAEVLIKNAKKPTTPLTLEDIQSVREFLDQMSSDMEEDFTEKIKEARSGLNTVEKTLKNQRPEASTEWDPWALAKELGIIHE